MTFVDFVGRLETLPRVVVQAHNFPDHDAVAAAFALSHLLGTRGIPTLLVYDGVIDRISLQHLVDWLHIPLLHLSDAGLTEDDHIILVDGCTGEKNVTDATGREIAVIDHHRVTPKGDLWFSDIRPDHGATVTLVYDYYRQLNVEIPRDVATAMQVGLAIDTANLTRGFCALDIEAFACFHRLADTELVNRITRNSLQACELSFYRGLLEGHVIHQRVAYAWIDGGCPKNMLGVLGDFMMAIDEVDATILAAPAGDVIHLSLRSELDAIDVARLVAEVLTGRQIGFGGGHRHMAGGIIHRTKLPEGTDPLRIFRWFREGLGHGD